MAPLQTFFLLSAVLILPFAWIRGGHPERAGVAVLLLNYVVGPIVQEWHLGRMLVGLAITDVAMLAALVWLALRHDRWWLLFAAAAQALAVGAHLALAVRPDLTERDHIAALWVFGVVALYGLLAGVGERRLAGEAPVAPPLTSRPAPGDAPT